jgi:hypothetical protein
MNQMNKIIILVLILMSQIVMGQIVINELDSDTPSIDDKEFVELLSETPNFPLDGYVLVFFNGSTSGGNSSYLALDLDGYITDINGLLLIGSNSVSPVPQYLISENLIQNGADAVAIYQADYEDFPEETLATIENLVDVLIYDTSDPDDLDLIDIFNDHPNFTDIQQINEGSSNNTNSIQRNNDGTYTSKTPTPRQLNDGSGIVLNGISMTVNQNQYNEGEDFDIIITLEEIVSEEFNINLILNNSGFNTSDFTGNTSLTIPEGQKTSSTTISLIDDLDDEGDEVAIIRYDSIPTQYLALNNNLQIRIVDNDFIVASYGTPINPTFGIVASTQPIDYYNEINGLADLQLRQALQDIIADPQLVRAQTYSDIIDILKKGDQNPANSNQVWLVYTEQGRAKLDFQTTSNDDGKWNREHTFPRSRGDYYSIEADEIIDGVDVFWMTNADSLRHGNSDAHALRAADGNENSNRGNQHYGEYNGPAGTLGSFKGDVARSVLYMDIRYNGLEIVSGFPNTTGQLGNLDTLLNWHRNDPPDDYEMNRNNVVYTWQFNRNPFIDHPDLVEYLWGNKVGDVWDPSVSTNEIKDHDISIYPNPTLNNIFISGIQNEAIVDLISFDGRKIKSIHIVGNTPLDLNLSPGIYWLKIRSGERTSVEKLIVL